METPREWEGSYVGNFRFVVVETPRESGGIDFMTDAAGEHDLKLQDMSFTAMEVDSVETISVELISVEAISETSQEMYVES